jgi:hypothetical protein
MHELIAPRTRRQLFCWMAGGTIAAALAIHSTSKTDAARRWCLADPVLKIDGQKVHVYISSPPEMLKSATDKIRLVVSLPPHVDGKLIAIESDFGKGYDVDFRRSSNSIAGEDYVPLYFAIYCPARDGSLQVNVDIAPVSDGLIRPASTTGTANNWITLASGQR